MKDRKVKHALFRDWYQWKGHRNKERMREGQYGRSTMYSFMKINNETC
jgi:hypothetical protein